MLAVPLTHLLWIGGLEEYSTDPQDSPSLTRHGSTFLRACRICRSTRLLLRGANRQQQYSQSGENGHQLAQHAADCSSNSCVRVRGAAPAVQQVKNRRADLFPQEEFGNLARGSKKIRRKIAART
jgi:hypothetical protein